ncbi:MAG TPA: DUF1737 domain-containing protein [Bryobacteraceae bacterium]|nr:DUF1737 domain-containing protein [Bryobacteraceae bacterium]
MTYQLVTARSDKDLTEKVNPMISEGWEPQGGVAVGGDAPTQYVGPGTILPSFVQAMVKPQ